MFCLSSRKFPSIRLVTRMYIAAIFVLEGKTETEKTLINLKMVEYTVTHVDHKYYVKIKNNELEFLI